jgi:uncharacterized damage-inducible protein DinB
MTTPSPTSRGNDKAAALSPAELLYDDLASEHAATRRFLERYPDGKGAWRPHEKSRTLTQLATHVADIINRGTVVLETNGMEVGVRPPLAPMDSARELTAYFDDGLAKFNAALASTDFDRLGQLWAIRHGSRVMMELPRRTMVRKIMISHLIHHRGQLSVYYRLLGVPVPGAYGPSADD